MRRIGLLFVLLVLLAVVGAAGYALGTSGGARLLADAATSRLPLVLDGIDGSVLAGLRVARLEYEDPGASVVVDDLAVKINLRCALRRVICLPAVSARSLAVTVAGGDGEGGDDPLAFLAAMPRIEVGALALDSLLLALPGNRQSLRDVALAGRIGPQAIDVEALAACHAQGCVEARGGIDARGHWRLVSTLAAASAPLAEQGLLLPRRYALDADGDLTGLAATLTAPESPALAVEATLAYGDPGAIAARADVRGLAEVVPALADQPWLALDGALSLRAALRGDTVELNVAQDVAGYAERPLPLRAALVRQAGQWRIDDATLGDPSRPRLRVRGTLGAEDDLAPALGIEAARLRAPPATGVPLEEVSGKAEIAFRLASPAQTWSLRTPGLFLRESGRLWQVTGDLRAGASALLPLGSLTGTLRDPAIAAGAPLPLAYTHRDDATAAQLRAPDGLAAGGLTLTRLEVDVREDGRLHLDLRSEGDVATALAVDLAVADDGIDATLAPFSLTAAGETFTSPDPVVVRWQSAAREIDLGAFCIAWQGSRGCSDGARLGETGDVTLALRIDETRTGTLGDSPYAVEARGAGQLAVRWSDWALADARVELDFDTLAIDPFVGSRTAVPVRWERSHVAAQLTPDGSEASAELVSQQFGRLELALGLRGEALSGRLRADGLTMAAITDLVPEWSIDDGRVEADLRLAGTRSAPEVFGSLRLVDGGARIEAIETALSDLQLDATFEGRDAALTGYANVGGGDLRLEGRCCTDNRLEGIVIGDRNRLRLPVGLDALLSPSLDFALDPEQLTVTGSLTVHEGVFEHSGLGEGGVAVSDDVVRLDAPAQPPRRFRLYVDLRTLIEPGFTLRSKQIESTLGGDLRLVMPASGPPSLFGNLDVLGGELRVYGQALRLTDGALGFVGDPLNPDLAISAEREIRTENQRVGFRVRGTLEEPLFELFSDPQRPDNETLSYLLRGRGPDVGVAADGTAMALSLGASALNQSGVLAPLNAIPGLSGVTLGAEGTDEDMSATISAYVGNRLYLSYGVGIYEPINALTARLYLRSRLWLEVVSRLESSFDLYYRFDRN